MNLEAFPQGRREWLEAGARLKTKEQFPGFPS